MPDPLLVSEWLYFHLYPAFPSTYLTIKEVLYPVFFYFAASNIFFLGLVVKLDSLFNEDLISEKLFCPKEKTKKGKR